MLSSPKINFVLDDAHMEAHKFNTAYQQVMLDTRHIKNSVDALDLHVLPCIQMFQTWATENKLNQVEAGQELTCKQRAIKKFTTLDYETEKNLTVAKTNAFVLQALKIPFEIDNEEYKSIHAMKHEMLPKIEQALSVNSALEQKLQHFKMHEKKIIGDHISKLENYPQEAADFLGEHKATQPFGESLEFIRQKHDEAQMILASKLSEMEAVRQKATKK